MVQSYSKSWCLPCYAFTSLLVCIVLIPPSAEYMPEIKTVYMNAYHKYGSLCSLAWRSYTSLLCCKELGKKKRTENFKLNMYIFKIQKNLCTFILEILLFMKLI